MHQRLESMLQLVVHWPTPVHTEVLSNSRYHPDVARDAVRTELFVTLSSWYFHDATVLRCMKSDNSTRTKHIYM
jgi:hypothetical protein